MGLGVALKEWDAVIQSLLVGEQVMLLRKGGIREEADEFVLEHRRFLLFPTFVHQDIQGVKEQWRPRIISARHEPDMVKISGWAEVVNIWQVRQRAAFDTLNDLHIWEKRLVDMRFSYRPENPLYVVALRTWHLPAVVEVKNMPAFAGCKSWVPLPDEIKTAGSTAAVDETRLQQFVARIADALG